MNYSVTGTGGGRIHYVSAADVEVLLSRLPSAVLSRLKGIHFNDRSRGNRYLGYVNRGRHDIALCALPPRIRLTRHLRGQETPEAFGAASGIPWPKLAVRRLMLYAVLLHEIGHLQVVKPHSSTRLRYALESSAERFADNWRNKLWAEYYNHPDPVHNSPSRQELAELAELTAVRRV